MFFSHYNNLKQKVTCFFKALAKYQQLGLSEYLYDAKDLKRKTVIIWISLWNHTWCSWGVCVYVCVSLCVCRGPEGGRLGCSGPGCWSHRCVNLGNIRQCDIYDMCNVLCVYYSSVRILLRGKGWREGERKREKRDRDREEKWGGDSTFLAQRS